MSVESAISFFLAILVFGVTPGPGVFAILARALAKGAGDCVYLALGMTISDILYLVAACLGLAVIATQWGEAFTIVRVIGAIYLLYLGWKMWNTRLDLISEDEETSGASRASAFVQGFLISASNPKVILFYIAFLPTFMDLSVLTAEDIALASLLTLVALMIGLMSIAFCAARARLWFRSKQAMERLNKGAGSLLVGAAVYLVTRP